MSDDIRETLREAIGEARGQEQSQPEAPVSGVLPDAAQSADATAAPDAPVSDGAGDVAAPAPVDSGRPRDASGKFVKADADKTQAPKPQKHDATQAPKQGQPKATPAPQVGQPTQTPAPKFKAPQSWKLPLREKWGALPEEIQAEVDRREKEIAAALNETAEPKKFHQAFQQAIAPYQQFMVANRMDPIATTRDALQMVSTLSNGVAGNVAGLLANAINEYGIKRFGPDFVSVLASAIDGNPQNGPAQPQLLDPASIAQQAEENILRRLQERAAQKQTAMGQKEVQDFLATEPEFIDEPGVREHMAALLSSAGERAISLKDAYDSACWVNKDVRSILQQREAAQQAKANQASTMQARAAASSVKSQPASINGASVADGSIRDTLREALAESRRR